MPLFTLILIQNFLCLDITLYSIKISIFINYNGNIIKTNCFLEHLARIINRCIYIKFRFILFDVIKYNKSLENDF